MNPLLLANAKFEPGRMVYVLLSTDRTHVYALPNGEPDWSYNKADMDLRQQILEKDLKNFKYKTCELPTALVHIANHQAELERLWTPILTELRKKRKLEDRFNIYRAAIKKTKAHPISMDSTLKRLLDI